MRSIDAVPLPGGKLGIPVHPWLFRHAGNRRIGPPGAHRLSLIRSLIQLRPPGFTWPLSAVPTQVADGDDRRRTRIHRLGKRVGDSSRSRSVRERPSDELSDNRHRQRWTPADTYGLSLLVIHAATLAVRTANRRQEEEATRADHMWTS